MTEITDEYGRLTKHPEGSVRELFAISFPLMMSILSGNLMMFFDRLILANYSLEAMNAAAASGMACMVFQYGAIGIASIAEVFVGQFNGAKRFTEAAGPAWQMIWFSLFSSLIFYPVAFLGGPFIVADYHYQEYGLPYFQWLLFFGPFFAIQAAISAFFIGIGKVRLVTVAAILANVVNILLDLSLVFGISPYVPSLGTMGAAVATGISQLFQIGILIVPFLSYKYRKKYHTQQFSLKPKLFLKCMRIGTPSAIGHMIEITAWALIARMMISVSEVHILVIAVGQSFYTIIAFGMEGLQKGVTTIAANFIGAKKWRMVAKTWKAAVKLLFIFAALFSIIMLIYPDPIIHEFLSEEKSPEEFANLYHLLRITCVFVWIYFIVDGLTWISAGVLTAAGDTLFVMVMNAISAWIFALIPIYIFIVHYHASPVVNWMLINFYGSMNAFCFYLRYRLGGWRKLQSVTS